MAWPCSCSDITIGCCPVDRTVGKHFPFARLYTAPRWFPAHIHPSQGPVLWEHGGDFLSLTNVVSFSFLNQLSYFRSILILPLHVYIACCTFTPPAHTTQAGEWGVSLNNVIILIFYSPLFLSLPPPPPPPPHIVGARDHTSLSQDAVPPRGDTN